MHALDLFYTLHVSLRGSDPLIWRRVEVPGLMPLSVLQGVLLSAMGWEGSHLSGFEIDGKPYDVENEPDCWLQDLLTEVGACVDWVYDYGDHWLHEIRVEAISREPNREWSPKLVAGERACPIEDVGGIYVYQDYVEHWRDESHPATLRLEEWCGETPNPEIFELNPEYDYLGYYRNFRYFLPFLGEMYGLVDSPSGCLSVVQIVTVLANADCWRPVLCEAVHRLAEDPAGYPDEDYVRFPTIALYLLAGMRANEAGPAIRRLACLEEDVQMSLLPYLLEGDEEWGRVLAGVSIGAESELFEMFKDPTTVLLEGKQAALDALEVLYRENLITREKVVACLRSCFEGGLERNQDRAWDNLLIFLSRIHPGELIEEARAVIREILVSEDYLELFDIESVMMKSQEEVLAEFREDEDGVGMIDDVTDDLARALGESLALDDGGFDDDEFEDDYGWPADIFTPFQKGTPIVREGPKVGRNDPCPCGSGKKYKKCCGG